MFSKRSPNLLTLGRREEARPYFAQAHAALSGDSHLVAHEASRLQRLADLAQAGA